MKIWISLGSPPLHPSKITSNRPAVMSQFVLTGQTWRGASLIYKAQGWNYAAFCPKIGAWTPFQVDGHRLI